TITQRVNSLRSMRRTDEVTAHANNQNLYSRNSANLNSASSSPLKSLSNKIPSPKKKQRPPSKKNSLNPQHNPKSDLEMHNSDLEQKSLYRRCIEQMKATFSIFN